ncbi:MAG TPA: hypothetical protein ENK73_00135 [Thiomicrospira sp.]|jgi:hypothetical protein|nr:hypothetical protein [Thiomicrospira sp.]
MQINSDNLKRILADSVNDFTREEVLFLTSKELLAKRMRYVLASLEGYRTPSMLAEVLLQSSDSQLHLWQKVESSFVFSKKISDEYAKQTSFFLNQLASQGWTEFRTEKARSEGGKFARSMDPDVLVEKGQELQFSENPYGKGNYNANAIDEYHREFEEAWQDGFHHYLCLIREESW